jgi:hypothetical protein
MIFTTGPVAGAVLFSSVLDVSRRGSFGVARNCKVPRHPQIAEPTNTMATTIHIVVIVMVIVHGLNINDCRRALFQSAP